MKHHKNIQKSLLAGMMIGFASLSLYHSLRISVANFGVITAFVLFASWFVDAMHEIMEKRKK